jgi:drug/metabolite transporter (DMT)-like permease
VALAADLVVFGVTMRAVGAEHQESPGMALLVQMSLLVAYLASIAVRTLVRGRNVIPFEVVQTSAALVVGLGGAISVTRATDAGAMMLGVASMLVGAACYAVAFAFLDRQQNRGRNVYFYTTLALVLVLVGSGMLLPATALDLTFAALAVFACVLWSRLGRLFFLLHGAAYLLAAGLVSGTLGYAAWAFASGQTGVWRQPGLGAPVVAGAGLFAAWLTAGDASEGPHPHARWPRFAIILVAVGAVGGVLVGLLAPEVAGAASGTVDPGALATLRTVVLALAALAVAWVGRHEAYKEWAWLVYPLLVVTGLKMVAQDFMQSRPATMFVGLALYGAALIFAPRLRRRQT